MLLLFPVPTLALRDDLSGIFIKRPRLRQGFDGLFQLRVVFQIDFVSLGQAEYRDERFFLDLALDPGEVLSDVGVGVLDFFLDPGTS